MKSTLLGCCAALALSLTSCLASDSMPQNVGESLQGHRKIDRRPNSQRHQTAALPPLPSISISAISQPTDDTVTLQRDVTASTRMLARDTKRLADYTLLLVGVGFVVGCLQLLLLVFQNRYTGRAARAAQLTAEATQMAQRAYLNITPASFGEWQRWPSIEPGSQVVVANHGNTPTRVTEVVVTLHLNEERLLPERPDAIYGTAKFSHPDNFLLPQQSFGVTTEFERFNEDTWQRWRYGNDLKMWLVSYADYIDIFGERRRRGVAYVLDRFDQAQFQHEPKARYNYDRRRNKGEGRDWDEPPN